MGATNPVFRLLEGPDGSQDAKVRRVGGLTFWAETLEIQTESARQFVDITEKVGQVVQRAGVSQGWVSAFSKHTTAAVIIQENEPQLLQDMTALLERLSSASGSYRHNDLSRRIGPMEPDECANGHAHCQHLLLGTSENIPIADGQMDLGRWQRIFLLELDRPRNRRLAVQVFGA